MKLPWTRRKALAAPPLALDAPFAVHAGTLTPSTAMRVSQGAVDATHSAPVATMTEPFQLPLPPPGVLPGATLAMDLMPDMGSMYGWAAVNAVFTEGLKFLGYAYLSELSQRPEYRSPIEIIARTMTRKWIKFTGMSEQETQTMTAAFAKFRVKELFQKLAEVDGYFGRAQLYVDTGASDADLQTVLMLDPTAIKKGGLKGFRVIEPIWTYPGQFNATNPLDPEFYVPPLWYVMGRQVHRTRLLTFVAREVPDILKAAYSFGGMPMSQLLKPYVDNWLRTRQSVSDIIHAFTVWVLSTNMGSILKGGESDGLMKRLAIFNNLRDNKGVMAIDKETETFANVSVTLSTLDGLQAQSQEQMAAVSQLPLSELLGITPTGLNATTDGETRIFYTRIKSGQEHFYRPHLTTVFQMIQLDTFGAINPKWGFEFIDLWEMDAKEEAAIRTSDANADAAYVTMGAVSNDEVRERLNSEEGGMYQNRVPGAAPEVEDPDVDDGSDDDD